MNASFFSIFHRRRQETESERSSGGPTEKRSAAVLRQELETGHRRQLDERHGQHHFEIRRLGKRQLRWLLARLVKKKNT